MRLTFRAAAAVLLLVCGSRQGFGQTASPEPTIPPVGSVLPGDVVQDLPLGATVYSILENIQPEVIPDRFNSGGLNVGGDVRAGGFLGSWSQTLFRIGDIDVSDPSGSGSSLMFPETALWQQIDVATGLMPADINTPGLAVTLQPRRATSEWSGMFTGIGSGGGLAAGAPTGHPPPIARLKDFAHGTGIVSGPLSQRVGLVAGATLAGGDSFARELLPGTSKSNVSGFAHVVFAPSPARELRVLGWVQQVGMPFENWQAFQDPSAETRSTAVHVQSTLEQRAGSGPHWRVFAGLTQRARTTDVRANSVLAERITGGPIPFVVDAAADTTARRISFGGRLEPLRTADTRHHLEYGANVDVASLETSGAFAGTVREQVDAVPARTWTYAPVGTSNRGTTTVAAFASDAFRLNDRVIVNAGLRAELVHGGADGASQSVTWFSLLPHAYARWALTDSRALLFGYARSGNALTQTWLAYGDPNAPVAQVAATRAPGVLVARMGPGTGGDPQFSQVDSGLGRPVTDEFVVGYERRRSPTTRYTLTGIARRESNMLGVVNTGVGPSAYVPIGIQDAGQDWDGPADDRTLYVYNRLPSSFGQDTYLLTNPDQDAATAFALRMAWEMNTDRLFMLLGATASAAFGSGGNRGYGPLENDQDTPGELFTSPNGASYARGRLFADRAFTIKWTALYRFPWDITAGGIARYQDGQPFSRLVLVPELNQGIEGVQAYPNAGSRYTFIGSLDLRLQKGFRAGPTRIAALMDVYNLFTRNNSVEEYVVTGPDFRNSIAIQPPRSVHFGVRVGF